MLSFVTTLALGACSFCTLLDDPDPVLTVTAAPDPAGEPEAAAYEAFSKEYDAMLAAEPAPSTARTAAPLVAHDDDDTFSYTFLEVGAVSFDIDQFDEDAEVLYGRAQLGLFDFLHLFFHYENLEADFNDTSTDLLKLGGGVHFTVAPKLDLVADIAWLYNDVDSDLSNLDDITHGYEVRAGPRWMPFEWSGGGLELAGNAIFVDLDNRIASDDQAWGWEAGLRVHFLKLLSLGAMYTEIDDDDSLAASLRVSF